MNELNPNDSGLAECGWTSFDVNLFLNEPGRIGRDVAPAYVDMLRAFCTGPEVLELCCGSGRQCIALARAGYRVTGIDLSPDMLRVAERAAAAEPAVVRDRLRFFRMDMRGITLDGRFDFIILEDDGFVYLLTQQDQLACLTSIREHLADDGKGLLVFATPQVELRHLRSLDGVSPGKCQYDPIAQVTTCPARWSAADEAGRVSIVEQGFERRRLTYPCELELLLGCSGFRVLERWGDLDGRPFSDPKTQEYHYLFSRHDLAGR